MIVAVLETAGRRAQPLLFDGVPRMPAGVFVADDGTLVTGREGLEAAAAQQDRYLAKPATHLTSESVQVGGSPADPVELVGAALRAVADQAAHAGLRPVTEAVLVIPAGWGPRRRTALRLAAHRAGLPEPTLVDTAKAIAQHLSTGSSARQAAVPEGSLVLVYRLVESAFEVAILRRQGSGWNNQATIGVDDLSDLTPAAAIERTMEVVRQAVDAIDATAADITAVYCQAPLASLPPITAALRQAGLTAPLLTATEFDAAYGGLAMQPRTSASLKTRVSALAQAARIAVPALGAALVLWFKLTNGRYWADNYDIPPLSYIR
ncbi:MAG: hypothetical protein QOE61_4225, partial [Micromonosporaceae bacterium]|nr:hypothetical protein [Micromonosporaceae bacterium]